MSTDTKEKVTIELEGLGEVGKTRLKETVKAFTDEEKTETIKLIPSDKLWEELIRRNTSMVQRINEIEDVLGISVDNIYPITIKAWEDIQRRFNDVEEKFKKIAKGFRSAN